VLAAALAWLAPGLGPLALVLANGGLLPAGVAAAVTVALPLVDARVPAARVGAVVGAMEFANHCARGLAPLAASRLEGSRGRVGSS